MRSRHLATLLIVFVSCGASTKARDHAVLTPSLTTPAPEEVTSEAPKAEPAASRDAGSPPPIDPMGSHRATREGLLALLSPPRDDPFFERVFGVDGPRFVNQGNKAIARHEISKARCLDELAKHDIVIQTAEQRAICGAENMVPVWRKGEQPTTCIDVFEFPNQACELPMVWASPSVAEAICERQGKRLCSDVEWNLACRGDPEGGPDRRYAYGDTLDLEICHTNLKHRTACNARGPQTAWTTCATDTEPSGSFPRCRSRFGVFDQHGNVAEIMSRKDGSNTVTQLKGSAWFYVEVAKEPGKPPPPTTMSPLSAYPDHCNFDPRWHVEPLSAGTKAIHTNYHLGFRCCRSIPIPIRDAGAP